MTKLELLAHLADAGTAPRVRCSPTLISPLVVDVDHQLLGRDDRDFVNAPLQAAFGELALF